MKTVIALLVVLVLSVAYAEFNFQPLSDEEIFYINNVAKTTWKAGRNFRQDELKRVIRMLGVNIEKNKEYNKLFVRQQKEQPVGNLPTNFDPRIKWPNCTSLNEIRDQADCGSCWAFGSVEAMTDRICIQFNMSVHISAEDVLACCTDCGAGCNGGYPSAAWNYYANSGVVTGGQYGTKQGCMPYTLPPCDHHTTGRYKPCSKSTEKTPKCKPECEQGYNKTYKEDKHFGENTHQVKDVQQVMSELVNNGPVTAAFDVYSDFPSYKSGVYHHTTGKLLGGHAVKIIGYGVENGTDYWLVANSWNTDWGEKGFFKIRRGNDECGIEDYIVTGSPKRQ